MKIRVGTFNLFQFCAPPHSWYTKKEKFSQEQWLEKTAWIKEQITQMDCDVIGFQEVFSTQDLKELLKELGFEYFLSVEEPKTATENKNIYVSTTVALASKYPIAKAKEVRVHIPSLEKHHFKKHFAFSRIPIKANITFPNNVTTTFYVCHLKSNRLNEFEYVFNKTHTLEQKKLQVEKALKDKYSEALKQRLCEASSLFFDIKKQKKKPCILMCDLNDKEYSITIDALTNNKYHDEKRKETFTLVDANYQFKRKIKNPHPEQKELKRIPTSYFAGYGNVLDYVFISNNFNKKNKQHIAQVSNYEVYNAHLAQDSNGSLAKSDHAQVVCELDFL